MPYFIRFAICASAALLLCGSLSWSEPPDPSLLKMEAWTPEGMVKDPVAVSFDNQGRLYVVETARRGTVDIDVRAHRPWLLEDLASQDFESMRDFFRRRMSTELSNENKDWLEDRNQDGVHDYHDLTTVKERVRLVEDTDGDGKADKSTLFAEGFHEEFNGVAAGVMPYDGDVFFTIYPDLWRLRDHNQDGKADSQESMFRGFGVHAAFDGHDLHGLTVGPEGKIYFSCGDNGFSITNQEGKHLHHPNTGGVLRMNPDGSDLEVFAIGLRNVQEFDFDRYGNMFGVDNDGDLEDERERAVYIAEGSDSGWRLNWQFRAQGWSEFNGGMTYNPWIAEGMWKPQHPEQPAYITPPMQNYSVGPGGFKFNPGTALNDQYRDFFFCVQFPVQQVTSFRTVPNGAGFKMMDEHVFNSGLMVSSLNFGPDGGIYLADWVGKWQPNDEGIIYRVDDPIVAGTRIRQQVKQLINDGVQDKANQELTELLGHQDRRVRHLAQHELAVSRKQLDLLVAIANDVTSPQLARIHALWGTIQFHQRNSVSASELQLPWRDADPQIRQQCARLAGDLRLSHCAANLVDLLSDDVALVQSHAAIALGKLKSADAVGALVELLRKNAEHDPFIRHAAVFGLAGCATPEQLVECNAETHAVRLGAVLALRRQKSSRIEDFLGDRRQESRDDIRVLREAVRAIHDDFSIPAALPALARSLGSSETSPMGLPLDEPILRRAISANFRLGGLEHAERIIRFIIDPAPVADVQLREAMQIEALHCLAKWDQSPIVDRVEGRIRSGDGRYRPAGRDVLVQQLPEILASAGPVLAAETLNVANDLQLPVDTQLMSSWVTSREKSTEARVGALRLLADRNAPELDTALKTAVASTDWPVRRAGLEIMTVQNPRQAWESIDWMSQSDTEQQAYISLLPRFGMQAATAKLDELVRKQIDSIAPDPLALDILIAARNIADDSVKANLDRWETKLRQQSTGEHQLALLGGDELRGEQIYKTHVSAQCTRCHEAGGMGKQAGPVLDDIGRRVDRQYLLESLIQPSAAIAKGFGGVTLVLLDGRVLTGTIIKDENGETLLGTPDGKQVAVPHEEIDERVESSISAMPEMSKVLTLLEIRDLVAYLATKQVNP